MFVPGCGRVQDPYHEKQRSVNCWYVWSTFGRMRQDVNLRTVSVPVWEEQEALDETRELTKAGHVCTGVGTRPDRMSTKKNRV